MHIGHYISGAGHAVLIGYVLFGGVFSSDPPEVEVTTVDVISAAEFAALTRPATAPEPLAPEVSTRPAPRPEPEPEPDPAPPPPPTVVPDPAPQPPAPPPAPQVDAPITSDRPVPRPADRVAPTPITRPDGADTAPDTQESARPAPAPEPPAPEQEATAPEETTTEIVTEAEAETPAAAPRASLRPQARPNRQVAETPPPDPEPETPPDTEVADTPDTSDTSAAVNAALADLLGGTASETTSPPLTRGEREGLRVAVEQCWQVDVGSQAANVTVTVAMSMTPEGRVIESSIRQVSASGGDATATNTAFQAARRAILLCGRTGYDLPTEKYEQWKDIELTFNPEKMRLR